MAIQKCAALDSAKRLAAFEELEMKLKGAPFVVLSLLDKAWDKEHEIFEISLPNSKAGAAAKLQAVLQGDGSYADPKPFPVALRQSLQKLHKLLERNSTQQQLRGRAKTVRALLPTADRSHLTNMVETVLVAIEYDYSEFGEQATEVRGAKPRAGKGGSIIAA